MEQLNWFTDRVTMLFQHKSLYKANDFWEGALNYEIERISNKELVAA
jgi:hypothetical protein